VLNVPRMVPGGAIGAPQRRRRLAIAAVVTAIVAGISVSMPSAVRAAGVPVAVRATTGLAYMTGGTSDHYSVWLAGRDRHGAHELGPGFAPMLSPDGRQVVALDETDLTLIDYSSAGIVLHRFFAGARVVPAPLAWSRDSRYLAVRLQPSGSATTPAESLAVIDTATGRKTTVATGMVQGASFAPSGPERLVFGLARRGRAGPELYEAWLSGRPHVQLTHDGRSLNPVWGRRGIVFDREKLRTRNGLPSAPAYQLVLLGHGRFVQITHMNVFWLSEGLVPVGVSGDGTRLAADMQGEDLDQGWSVNLVNGRPNRFPSGLTADGISRDGRRVLLESMYGWMYSPQTSVIETMPFSGGRAASLVKPGGKASWNQ
jgi:hypothetical protein